MGLEKLWNDGYIPLIDGLILSNGEIKLFDIAVYPEINISFMGDGELSRYLEEDPDDVTEYDIYGTNIIDDKTLKFGAGGFGSDGFLACFSDGKIEWLFFSSTINPVCKACYVNPYFIFSTDNEFNFKMSLLSDKIILISN